MENVEPSGYVSLGQYTAGERGETHYIYANYPDFVSQLKSNVDIPPQRDIRDSQPTISVNYRVIKNTEEDNFERDKNYSNYRNNKDDWDNDDNDW